MDLTCSSHLYSAPLTVNSINGGINPFNSDVTLRSSSVPFAVNTILLLLLGSFEQASSVITNVSVIQSWRWFMHLSPFESIFLFFIIFEIGVLSLLGMLPINFTEFWQGEPSGRRKRRRRRKRTPFTNIPEKEQHVAQVEHEIGIKLLNLYKKLDQNQCGFRALCELQHKVKTGEEGHIPFATQLMLTTLHSYADHENGNGNRIVDMSHTVYEAVNPYVEAVKIGSLSGKGVAVTSLKPTANLNKINAPVLDEYYYGNVTVGKTLGEPENLCQSKYSTCPVTSEEIMEYISRIHLAEK